MNVSDKMASQNPFIVWGSDPNSISGRDEDVKFFGSMKNAVASNRPAILLFTGGAGMGKTILLRKLRIESQKDGFVSPYVHVEKGDDPGSVVKKLHIETAYSMKDMSGTGVRKFRQLSEKAEFFEKKTPCTIPELLEITLSTIGTDATGIIFFLDDFDFVKKTRQAISDIVGCITNRGMPVAFVLSSTKSINLKNEYVKQFPIPVLSEHDIRGMITTALKNGPKMGEQCLTTIMNASGGNPRLVKTICWLLYDRLRDTDKIITKGHYLAALPSLMGLLGREWFGEIYSATPNAEKEILKILASEESQMHVSDISRKIGKPLGPVTSLVARLVETGQVVKVDRGVYRLFSRLYERYVLSMNPD